MRQFIRNRISPAFRQNSRKTRVFMAVALAAVTVASCDVHGISGPGSLASIELSPNPKTLAINGAQQFTAIGRDFEGRVVDFSPSWSTAAGGGSVNGSGMFTAGTVPGTFTNTVTASANGVSGTATVTVTPGPLASIVVTPNPQSMVVATTQQFTAVGKDASGNIVAFTPNWSVVAGGGAISSTGLFTAGLVTGTYTNTIQASSGTLTGSATVTVTAGPLASITLTPNPVTLTVGGAQQFVATGKDANGNVVTIAPVWSVVAGGGTITAAGIFTAGTTLGTFPGTVRAAVGSVSGVATVTVVAGALSTITVSPNPATLAAGAAQQFAAVGKDVNGNVIPITPIWSVTQGGGTINSSTGLFTAGSTAGIYANTATATSGTVSGSATVIVTVTPVPSVASIIVTPNPATVQAGLTQQFTAAGFDGNGNPIAITPVWSVVNGGGTINSSTGVFTAGSTAGAFIGTVSATSGGATGTATVIVTSTPVPPILATIVVTPNPALMAVNGVQQFTATGRDGNGNLIAFTPVWSVVNGGGTINPGTGVFTAGTVSGTFVNTVVATSGTVSGAASVTIAPIIIPPPSPINLGTAAANGIMAGTAFTCVVGGIINANIAISPGSTVTGFPPCIITGVQHLADAVAAQAQIDLTAAYNQLAGLPCPPANIISANLGGTTKSAGVYCSATGIGVTGTLILDGGGDPNALFVFQAGTSLTTAGNIVLINGAQAKNVYWQVGSSATIGTASQWQGNIIALTSITLVDNATLLGRALARNGAVSLGTNNVITLP